MIPSSSSCTSFKLHHILKQQVKHLIDAFFSFFHASTQKLTIFGSTISVSHSHRQSQISKPTFRNSHTIIIDQKNTLALYIINMKILKCYMQGFIKEMKLKKFQILNEFFENLNIFIKFIILSTIAKLAAFVSI